VKAYQIDVIAGAMLCYLQQIRSALEARLNRQIMSDVVQRDRLDGIDQDLTFIHLVPPPDLDVWPLPDPDTASDEPAAHTFPKTFRKHHASPSPGREARDLAPGKEQSISQAGAP
jgi:hypothetical protein